MLAADLCDERHNVTITSTRRMRDLFQRRYWIRCWNCSLRSGPFVTWAIAEANRALWQGGWFQLWAPFATAADVLEGDALLRCIRKGASEGGASDGE